MFFLLVNGTFSFSSKRSSSYLTSASNSSAVKGVFLFLTFEGVFAPGDAMHNLLAINNSGFDKLTLFTLSFDCSDKIGAR